MTDLPAPQCRPVGDRAVSIVFAESDHRDDATEAAANALVIALDRQLAGAPPLGVVETVPALVSLLVEFDPIVTDHHAVEAAVRDALAQTTVDAQQPTTRHVEVCYDLDLAPDLDAVATACDLSVDAVVRAHLAGDYRVTMYGFAPGYAYLGGVPDEIRVARKATPVRGVPAGSVIIAGPQCLVTTLTMPTGWSVIGASPTEILRSPGSGGPRPFLVDPGDRVVFERIDRATFDRKRRAP